MINDESNFYKSLLKENKTKNLILYHKKILPIFIKFYMNFLNMLKIIIINSYNMHFLQLYINFLKINHDIHHFKLSKAERDLLASLDNKENIIYSSPFEYEFYKKN